jgi:malate synthase
MSTPLLTSPVTIDGPIVERSDEVLNPQALGLLAALHKEFEPRRQALLTARQARQRAYDVGARPRWLPETAHIRADRTWQVAPLPKDLQDRRVEITGPVDRKMVINGLNSGASCYMADFEDSTSPTWANLINGQVNLADAVRRTITFSNGTRTYQLDPHTATLLVRPRGWHLPERHISVDGQTVSGSLFDFAIYTANNGAELIARGSGPYFYLPKLESHLEARLWNDVFVFAQNFLDLPQGSIRATVLIETLPAAFEMDEILYELRDHSAGLNCGRWDYIFSAMKTLRNDPTAVLADRATITMTNPFMRSYSRLAIRTCHRRGAPAMGGMAAQIPIKNDETANNAAMAKVRADKQREVADGHDGTWVAHPALVPIARTAFDVGMPNPNQIDKQLAEPSIGTTDLLAIGPCNPITEAGLRTNLAVAIEYLGAWLGGNGCVPINNLMEDAATAEISRTQVWQWLHHRARLTDGRIITRGLVTELLAEESERIVTARPGERTYPLATRVISRIVFADELEDFLTLAAYDHLEG